MTNQDNKAKGDPAELSRDFEIPVEGSLGLLALGVDGIKAWRAVRDAAKKEGADDEKK